VQVLELQVQALVGVLGLASAPQNWLSLPGWMVAPVVPLVPVVPVDVAPLELLVGGTHGLGCGTQRPAAVSHQ
jgi:hypothetical protein